LEEEEVDDDLRYFEQTEHVRLVRYFFGYVYYSQDVEDLLQLNVNCMLNQHTFILRIVFSFGKHIQI